MHPCPICKATPEVKAWLKGLKKAERERRNAMREREVMAELRQSRVVSVFWLDSLRTRWSALNRMEKRGEISVQVLGFPLYRVTIHRKRKG
jgi:hypothetical protein